MYCVSQQACTICTAMCIYLHFIFREFGGRVAIHSIGMYSRHRKYVTVRSLYFTNFVRSWVVL